MVNMDFFMSSFSSISHTLFCMLEQMALVLNRIKDLSNGNKAMLKSKRTKNRILVSFDRLALQLLSLLIKNKPFF